MRHRIWKRQSPAPAPQRSARARLLKDPADVPSWIAMSVALSGEGKSEQAVEGLTRALAVMPDQPDLWVALGEALVAHNKGLVSPAARLAFDRASRIAPDHPAPRYYLGMAWLQAGKPDQALETWQALLASAPADAPWRENVARKVKAAQTMLAAGVGR
ncbi:tetratricopeptide repeat protein [Hankyongella ginsenosidimutans]|nr:tetratricopeptide repeat protein [Hankyongella ginsenosidimutans]